MSQIDILPAVDIFLKAKTGVKPEGKVIVIEMQGLCAAHFCGVVRGGGTGDVKIADYASVVGRECIWC